MNTCLKLTPPIKPMPVTTHYGGVISGYDDSQQCWVIDELYPAVGAASLLVKPGEGDKVCFVEMDGEYYITQVLLRQQQDDALLIESRVPLHWVAPTLQFTAFEKLELVSLNQIAVMGKNAMITASQSLIQQTENLIQKVGQCSLVARGLSRFSAKQQIITAEEDVRVDGKRINMG